MKIVKFASVGGLGFIADACFFYLFLQLGCPVMLARLLAFWLAACVTWLGNKHLTFACKQKTGLLKQWAKHMLTAHTSGLVNLLCFYLISAVYLVPVAFVVGVLVAAVCNYWLSKKYVFNAV